jgi:hypothetical protein
VNTGQEYRNVYRIEDKNDIAKQGTPSAAFAKPPESQTVVEAVVVVANLPLPCDPPSFVVWVNNCGEVTFSKQTMLQKWQTKNLPRPVSRNYPSNRQAVKYCKTAFANVRKLKMPADNGFK